MSDTVEFCGRTFGPGERGLVELPSADLSTHTAVNIPVHVVNGREPGPVLLVCAAIHGDEINGVEIIRRLLRHKALQKLHGTLVAVPIVNVLGFIDQSRYLPDRRDLNRNFPGSARGSLAGRIANLFLKEVVRQCTHGIDLHTGAVHRENFPQIRANLENEENAKMAEAFGVPTVINASLREGSLREAAEQFGVPMLVYEAGEALRFDERAIRAGVKGVLSVMAALEMVPQRARRLPRTAPQIARSSTWARAPQSGILRTNVRLGGLFNQGDELGVIADPLGDNEIAITAPVTGVVIGRTHLPVVYEGDALFHIASYRGTQVIARLLDDFDPSLATGLDNDTRNAAE